MATKAEKEHIKMVLRKVLRNGPNPGEGVDDYLNRMADEVGAYPGEITLESEEGAKAIESSPRSSSHKRKK